MKGILKNKAFRLYLNKIKKYDFERDLYELVEANELKKDTLFYDLVTLNYSDINYRKNLFEILTEYSSEEELLCLKIYEKCILIKDSLSQEKTLSIIDGLAVLCNETDHQYKVLFNFYRLSDGISLQKEGFYFLPLKDVIIEAKNFSKQVIESFNSFNIAEDWNDFLETLPEEIIEEKPKKNKIYEKRIKVKKWYQFWK